MSSTWGGGRDADKIICPHCGRSFHGIFEHIRAKHPEHGRLGRRAARQEEKMRRAMTNTDRETIMWRIADATGAQEREFQRAMGADWETSYIADWATTATTYKMLLADHRPAVHLPARMVTGRRA